MYCTYCMYYLYCLYLVYHTVFIVLHRIFVLCIFHSQDTLPV